MGYREGYLQPLRAGALDRPRAVAGAAFGGALDGAVGELEQRERDQREGPSSGEQAERADRSEHERERSLPTPHGGLRDRGWAISIGTARAGPDARSEVTAPAPSRPRLSW